MEKFKMITQGEVCKNEVTVQVQHMDNILLVQNCTATQTYDLYMINSLSNLLNNSQEKFDINKILLHVSFIIFHL